MHTDASEWHALKTEKVLEVLGTKQSGLSQSQAQERLQEFGQNKLGEEKKISPLKLFLEQFKGMLVIVLIIAGIISFIIGDFLEGIAIFAILVINAGLGFFQEYKAEKSLEALKKLTAQTATVMRDSKIQKIDAALLVPGDVVLLHTGDKVPADLRLFQAVNLKIDEAVLTGESEATTKGTLELSEKTAVADRTDMAFANTIVSYGRGEGIVVATGQRTEFGKIARLLKEIREEETPLKKKLESLGKLLIKIVTAIIAILFAIGLLEGAEWHEMFKVAISLGVAAIPEGLPAVITITLSIGVFQMAQKNVLTRRMPAVEALGSTTVICSDKTGTLTRNEMLVQKLYANNITFDVNGNGYNTQGEFFINGKKTDPLEQKELLQLLKIAAECNDSEIIHNGEIFEITGDPTEGSLVVAAAKAGVERKEKRVDEIPFDSERKMMTTIHEPLTSTTLVLPKISYTKGAPERIVLLCDKILESGKTEAFTQEKKKQALMKAQELAGEAYRVLGFAFKEVDAKEDAEKEMVFVGLAGLSDPPREGVKEALKTAFDAGIKVKIITGDNPATTAAVAKKLGFYADTITGGELDGLTEDEFRKIVQTKTVFARVSPEHKLKIVTSLRESGEIVAVTGDGVNDAPALKKADIGIAMGIKGTDVSKEAADIILKDDNFATIVVAVKEGRRIYDNIKNFVKYLLAANIGEVMIIAISILLNFALPLLPLQLLWLNIVTDSLPALALGTEDASKDQMKRKPRKTNETVLDGIKLFILIAGIVSTIAVYAAFIYGLGEDNANGASLAFLNTKEGFDFDSKARTMAFTTLIVFELMFVFSCRHQNKGIFSDNPLANRFLFKMVAVSFLLQVLVLYLPLFVGVNFFDTVQLNALDWLVVTGLGATSILVPYIDNAVRRIVKKDASSLS